jgi:hypothetical protein
MKVLHNLDLFSFITRSRFHCFGVIFHGERDLSTLVPLTLVSCIGLSTTHLFF